MRGTPRLPLLLCALLFGCEGALAGSGDAAGPADTGPRADSGRAGDAASASDASLDAPSADTARADAWTTPTGSLGCGRTSPATGELTLDLGGDTLQYIVSIPAAYDAGHPYPLGFGLHGANRTHANCHDGDCAGFQTVMENEAILVYPRSVSAGWQDDPSVRDRNMALFSAVLDRMLAEYCVEVGRVFVAGTSSGATFSNDLGCHLGDRLRAVIPVAGGLPSRTGCVGRPAALVIHGVDDSHVLFVYGENARDAYLAANGCSSVSDPPVPDLHARVVATRESHECADYRGCDPGLPVRWCEHSEAGYDGTTHGWPLFGGAAVWEFVSTLP